MPRRRRLPAAEPSSSPTSEHASALSVKEASFLAQKEATQRRLQYFADLQQAAGRVEAAMARMTARPATSPETPRGGGGGLWSPLSSPSHLRPSNQATPRSMRREELSYLDPSSVGSEDAGDDDADTAAEMLALSKSRVEKILGGLGVDANVETLTDVDAWIDSAASAAERELLQWEKLEADAAEKKESQAADGRSQLGRSDIGCE